MHVIWCWYKNSLHLVIVLSKFLPFNLQPLARYCINTQRLYKHSAIGTNAACIDMSAVCDPLPILDVHGHLYSHQLYTYIVQCTYYLYTLLRTLINTILQDEMVTNIELHPVKVVWHLMRNLACNFSNIWYTIEQWTCIKDGILMADWHGTCEWHWIILPLY